MADKSSLPAVMNVTVVGRPSVYNDEKQGYSVITLQQSVQKSFNIPLPKQDKFKEKKKKLKQKKS